MSGKTAVQHGYEEKRRENVMKTKIPQYLLLPVTEQTHVARGALWLRVMG